MLGRGHILDLGCGQGLLASWLRAALLCYESGSWPQGWPPAPTPRSTRGIELILEEHQDWHMLVRPHHLPLA